MRIPRNDHKGAFSAIDCQFISIYPIFNIQNFTINFRLELKTKLGNYSVLGRRLVVSKIGVCTTIRCRSKIFVWKGTSLLDGY